MSAICIDEVEGVVNRTLSIALRDRLGIAVAICLALMTPLLSRAQANYTHDALDRLTSKQISAYTVTYSVDGAGNLSSRTLTPSAAPMNGQCGGASGLLTATRPVAFLCAAGSINGFAGAGPWTWTCQGSNGGTNATTCSAPVPAIPSCVSLSGPTTATVGTASPYTANCVNTSTYVWQLNGSAIAACNNLTSCSVTFATSGVNTLTVAPALSSPASVTASATVNVLDAPACSAINGPLTATVGVAASYTATCANTSTYVWKLNGTQIAGCNNVTTCAVTFAVTGSNTLTLAPTATSAASATATLIASVSASPPAANCTAISGPGLANIPATANSQTYNAVCSNTTAYVWTLDGTALACTGASCTVPFTANTTSGTLAHVVTVAPSTVTSAAASLAVTQAAASIAPQCPGGVVGPISVIAAGGTFSYSASCTGATGFSWTVGGVIQSCAGSTCGITFPSNTTAAAINYTINASAMNSSGTTPLAPVTVTVASAAPCWLNISGTTGVASSVDATAAVDAIIITRFLLGLRGDALIAGLSPLGSRNTGDLVATFIGSGAQFDVLGRAVRAPLATVDGLILTRLMLGVPDTALLNGITIPAGVTYGNAAAIRGNVNSMCGTGY